MCRSYFDSVSKKQMKIYTEGRIFTVNLQNLDFGIIDGLSRFRIESFHKRRFNVWLHH